MYSLLSSTAIYVFQFKFFSLHIIELLLSFVCPKESNQRKRQPQIFFGINIFSAAHAIQLTRLTARSNSIAYLGPSLRSLKMLIFFQKRSGGISRLTAIWILLGICFLIFLTCLRLDKIFSLNSSHKRIRGGFLIHVMSSNDLFFAKMF